MAVRDFNKKRKPIDIEKIQKCYGCQYFYADQFHGFVSCHCGHEKYMTCNRRIGGYIDGMGDNVKSVGQKFINNDKDTVEHTIMGMKNEVTHETG